MSLDRGYATGSAVAPASLLPDNATKLERAASLTGALRRPLPGYLVKLVDDPWNCPEHLLGYCAFHYSVDLWRNAWPTAKKRSVIAHAIELARLKGTQEGIRRAIEIMDGTLIKAIVPFNLYLSRNYSEVERAAFLARQPQLRIYPLRTRGKKIGFMPGDCVRPHSDTGKKWFPIRSDAVLRSTPRAYLWDQGVETPLATVQRRWTSDLTAIDEFLEVRKRGKRRRHGYVGNCLPLFPRASTAASRVYVIRTSQTRLVPGEEKVAVDFVRPSLSPVSVISQLVEAHGFRKAMFAGGFRAGRGPIWKRAPHRSTATERVYHRLYLWDPERPALSRQGKTFVGSMRLGMPPKHAELKVRIRNKRPKRAFGKFVGGFLSVRDKDGTAGVLQAIRTHKVLSEKILVNTKTISPVRAQTGLKAGTVVAGQLMEII